MEREQEGEREESEKGGKRHEKNNICMTDCRYFAVHAFMIGTAMLFFRPLRYLAVCGALVFAVWLKLRALPIDINILVKNILATLVCTCLPDLCTRYLDSKQKYNNSSQD